MRKKNKNPPGLNIWIAVTEWLFEAKVREKYGLPSLVLEFSYDFMLYEAGQTILFIELLPRKAIRLLRSRY